MSDGSSVRAIYKVAKHEFLQVSTHPIIPVAGLIVIIVAFLTGAGGASDLREIQAVASSFGEDTLIVGFGLSWQPISMICTIMAIFLGATMISYDRWKNSLNVLLVKPLYRRDYVLGKFVGLSVFMFVFNTFTLMLVSFVLIIFFRGPESVVEFIWRLTAYIIVLSLICSLVTALNMLFGIISKNILFVTAASVTYVFFDWIWYNDRLLGTGALSQLTPVNLYNSFINPIRGPFSSALFDVQVACGEWLSSIIPYLAVLFIEISILLLVEIWLFTRNDNP